jgi:hypothetical protein
MTVLALSRMRLAGFVRTGRAAAPLLAALFVLAVLYGGGQAKPGEAYGVSAVLMFAVLAWQSATLLDAEPDVQRRLALVAAGRAGELAAGLLAAAAAALVSVVVAMIAPWPLAGMTARVQPGDPPLAAQLAVGVWAHAIAVPVAVALGALASRAVTRRATYGALVLSTGVVATIVLGLRGSAAPWLVPPVMAAARAAHEPDAAGLVTVTGHALAWTAAAVAAYAWLRRSRT